MNSELQLSSFFSSYKNKKVIIYGINSFSARIFQLFKFANIDVIAFCTEDSANLNKQIKNFILNDTVIQVNLPVLSFTELQKFNNKDSVVIQLAAFDENEAIKKFQEANINNFISKIKNINIIKYFCDLLELHKILPEETNPYLLSNNAIFGNLLEQFLYEAFLSFRGSYKLSPLIMIMPPKTGNNTLVTTLLNNNIHLITFWHTPQIFNKNFLSNYKNINFRFITSVRDPISILISLFFELNSSPYIMTNFLNSKFLNFFENLQENFDMFVEYYLSDQIHPPYILSDFYEKYNKHIFDITSQPFDKQAGYTIMKSGNVEVFIYQLEKLNDIYPYIFDWLEKPRGELVKGNEADSKIIAEAYKEFKKNFTISKKVFEKCYNDPVIQHCYSQEDIKKFKSRWISHVRQ